MPIRYRLKESRCLRSAFLVVHIGVLTVLWLTKLPLSALVPISLLIILSLIHSIFPRGTSMSWQNVNELGYAENRIAYYFGNEVKFEGLVMPGTVVTERFIVFHLKSAITQRSHHRFICRDALSAEDYRQLCVLLRLA
jgi:hypothetical protein